MQYLVVPFVASVGNRASSQEVADQLQALANEKAAQGWQYVGLESVDTHVAGSNGCFGFGATPSQATSVSVAVFGK
jgi:hypothetical protein